ncbi:XRE family transcriptional regulator [Sporolactobacillus shoreae]|uniref:XRE family transcriptional regulator n=1 Tax=Sporolactobacillus shoreae TaxID=1465501 RepID=A0A4Z0GK87_9BACL|nr:XRE family transcriptional regulator [Sporolactobacillus shoreae]
MKKDRDKLFLIQESIIAPELPKDQTGGSSFVGNILGLRIRFLRDEKNLSQVEMADQLNISNVQLNRYESGARKPDPEMLVQIADYLNVSVDFLLGRVPAVQESPSSYFSKDEAQLMDRIRHLPDMYPFIQDLATHPEKAGKLMKIWTIIRND